MEWLLIILIPAALWGVGRLGLWLLKDFFDAADAQRSDSSSARVLLFGFSELADDLVELLEKHNIEYLQIAGENELDKSVSYSHLIALSDSDLDNLMISRIGERMMNIGFQLILCNELGNDNIFQNHGMPYFYKKERTADEIIRQMFSVTEKVCQYKEEVK